MKRIFHTWEKWECFPAGFYENKAPSGMTDEEAEKFYKDFLSNRNLFSECCFRVITEWKNSCEHYLTNDRMNRIAWMGQASVCIYKKIPSRFRGGYNLLSDNQKEKADKVALRYINMWMRDNEFSELTMEQIKSKTEANLY